METTPRTLLPLGYKSETEGYSYPMNFKSRKKSLGRVARYLLSGGALVLLTSCSTENISGMGFPKNVSSVNDISLPLWQGAWIAAGVVGVFTAILIMYPAFRHRRKGDEVPKQTQYNVPVEVAYTIIPFIIVAVLFYFTAVKESSITKISADDKISHTIDVNAIQWSWQFTYRDNPDAGTITGTPAKPPTLVLPQGERVRFNITATDVVHGFWIPAFMIQMQNLPGVSNHLEFTANKLGSYPGRCNILCGRNHSQMLFTVKVVSPSDYEEYISTLKAA
ncbi:CyoA Heme/copper-type cytochrome/quinol oxidases, subunit 2 [actinobacterium SCGC AAA044-D11]|uniref:cytochrome-c oxidase n=1 Tax=freshwater metagenome TaxID=449393 RepID=A0A6J6B6M6_9ZZZZ